MKLPEKSRFAADPRMHALCGSCGVVPAVCFLHVSADLDARASAVCVVATEFRKSKADEGLLRATEGRENDVHETAHDR